MRDYDEDGLIWLWVGGYHYRFIWQSAAGKKEVASLPWEVVAAATVLISSEGKEKEGFGVRLGGSQRTGQR